MDKRILILMIIFLLLLTGCSITSSDVADGALEEPSVEGDILVDLHAITALMSAEKDDVIAQMGADFELNTLNSESVKEFVYKKQGITIYFAEGLDSNRIDTIELSGNIDIHGAEIGMPYDQLRKVLPANYVEWPTSSDYKDTTLEFYVDDFMIRFYIDKQTDSVNKVKIMRFITVEEISQMIKLNKDDFINQFGEPDSIYPTGPEDSYTGYYYGLFGLIFVFGEDSSAPGDGPEGNWAQTFAWDEYRVDINGVKMWMDMDQITNSLGTPIYEGPIQFSDNLWEEYILKYDICDIEVNFSSVSQEAPCRIIEFYNY